MTWIGLAEYSNTIGNILFQTSVINTLIFTGLSVTLEFLLALVLSLVLSSITKGKKMISTLLILPMVMPGVVTSLGWKFIYSPYYGILNYLLGIDTLWLANSKLALYSVVLADVWKTTPFVLMILLAGIASIPIDLSESIKVDGANSWQEFRYVTVPHLIPFFLVALTVRTIDAFTKVFEVVYILTGGGPGISTSVLPISIYRLALISWDWGEAATYSVMALILSAILTVSYLWVVRRRA
jgi:multiple sugar transport system permease protein